MARIHAEALAFARAASDISPDSINSFVRSRIWLSQLADFCPKAVQEALTRALDASAPISADAVRASTAAIQIRGDRVAFGDVEVPIQPVKSALNSFLAQAPFMPFPSMSSI